MASFPDNKYLGQLMAQAGSAASSGSEAKYQSGGGQSEAKEDKYLGHIEAKYSDQYSSAFYPTAAQVRGEAMSIILQKIDDL